MRVDPSANVEAFTKLADPSGEVQGQVAIGVLKQSMENAETATLQLLQSLEPHLGQRVDIRL
jgi:hypothetical protein